MDLKEMSEDNRREAIGARRAALELTIASFSGEGANVPNDAFLRRAKDFENFLMKGDVPSAPAQQLPGSTVPPSVAN